MNSITPLAPTLAIGRAALAAAAGQAGECPADKRRHPMATDSRCRAPARRDRHGAQRLSISPRRRSSTHGRLPRAPHDIAPGGIVPWHSHEDRPALILIVSGEITEYASNCAVPIQHKAGDITPETNPHLALVEEHGSQPVVIYAFDLFRVGDKTTSTSCESSGRLCSLHRGARKPPDTGSNATIRDVTVALDGVPDPGRSLRRAGHPAHPGAAYGVTPAAMGLAVNASTIGMAVAGLAVACSAAASIGAAASREPGAAGDPDRAARGRARPRYFHGAADRAGPVMSAAFTLTLS